MFDYPLAWKSAMTRHVPYDEFRKDPAKYMDEAGSDPLLIERATGSVVLVSEDDFEGLVETAHLLSSPENARRLLAAIKAADAGEFQEHGLIEQ
jgi:antitoxin YefM